MNANMTVEGTQDPSGLVAGGDLVTRPVILASSAAELRGTVLGKITATGKYIKSAAAAADGSQVPRAILVDDADASLADVAATCYDAGEFDEAKLILGAGHTAASVREALRTVGIHLKAVQV